MRTETQTIRIGEDMGPIDWDHEIARDMPKEWREAEKNPHAFLFDERPLIALRMYDGWPYWTPRPAALFQGPLGPEWKFFDSYMVSSRSVRPAQGMEAPEGGETRSGSTEGDSPVTK